MPLSRLTCPICLAELKLKSPVPEGTRLRCPKCKGSFVAAAVPSAEEEPAQEPVPEAADRPAEEEIAEAVEVVEERPRRKPGKKGGVPLWVWLTAGGVGLLLFWGCFGRVGIVLATGGLSWSGSGSGLPAISPSGRVTLANYNQIRKGMSEAQVKAILGDPSTSTDANLMHVDTWTSGPDLIVVSFKDDKAIVGNCHIASGPATADAQGALP